MGVNFKELKRKELQRLCKKHGLRANATNSQMADSLVSLFKICEKNKQEKVLSKGSRGNGSSIVEAVEGDAEKVIVIDEDEDELGSVLQSADRKSSPQSRRTSKKDEQIEPLLKDSGGCGDGQGTRVKWHEENAIILLDEEHDEPCPVLRSVDRKKCRRLSRKVGKLCEPSRSNEENELVGVLRNPKKDILVPVGTRRSRSMNSEVAQAPVIGKTKGRKDRQVSPQNADPPLDASKVEVNEVGTRKEKLSVMMVAGDGKVKRKGKSRNSFMKSNDEIIVSLPIEVWVTENLVGDLVLEKHANTVMGSDITFSIDGEQASKGTATRNEQGIEEQVLCTAGNLMKVAAGSVGTLRKKKRTRAALEEDSPVMEKEIDKLGFGHHPELLHGDDIVEPDVCFGSSQELGSPSSSNLASSRPCLLLSESQCGPAVITPTRKIETDSSGTQDKLKLQELTIFRNSEATMNTSAEEKIDSCHIQFSSSFKTKIVEVEQQSKPSLSSRKEIIDPQNLIVSNITDVSTIFSDHLLSSEFDGKDAESTKRRDHRESFSVSPGDIKMLNACKMEGIKFLDTNRSHGEPVEAGDGEAIEYESNLSAKGSEEKSNANNFKEKFESFQKFPDRQRLAEINSGEFFVPFESLVQQEELYQIKGGETFKFESNVQITQDNLKRDGEKLCSSEEPQAVGYVEGSEAKIFAVSPLTKMDETAPFGLSKRVDNLMEKLFCLKKVLRGEIAPLITDSSLPCKEEIFCIESHATTKKEMTSGEPFSGHEQESQALNALMPTDPVHEDYELDSSNSEVNIQNKTDEVTIISSPDALQGNPEMWKFMKSCEVNDTDEASPHECDFYIRSAAVEPCLDGDGDVDDGELLEIVRGGAAKPGEVLEKIRLVSPRKQSCISLESDRNSSANCGSKKTNLNSSITKSPAKDINHFENHRFSETLVGQNSLPKEAQAKHTLDVSKIESHEEIANTNSGDALQGKIKLLKCIESCAENNLDAAFPYQCNFSNDWQVVGESLPDDDINVREFVKIDQGATTKPGEFLEKMKFLSPSKPSCIDLEDERNSSTSCISKKAKLHNNITNSPAKDSKHCGTQCLSKTLDDHSSLPSEQAYANHSVDILEVKSQDGSIPGADSLFDDVSSEVKVSFDSKIIDPVEEIRRKLVNFCVSSSRKAVKSNILNTPITNSAGISSVCLSRDKENTQSAKMKHTSKRKIWNSATAGSIRRPLQSFTNQMI